MNLLSSIRSGGRLSLRWVAPAAVAGLLGATTSAQSTWYVDDDICPGGGAGTLADPFCRIQDGIDVALSGDRVLVLPGHYLENPHFGGQDVALVALGGPASTTIEGSLGPVVLFDAGEGPAARIEGFTIRGGWSGSGLDGNGIRCVGASPTIANNVIRDNFATLSGGGIHLSAGADARVLNNVIRSNVCFPGGGQGGGIYVSASAPRIESNVIQGNVVFADGGGWGGGVFVTEGSNVELHGNLIVENAAVDRFFNLGGGVFCMASRLTAVGNTFARNRAADGTELSLIPGRGGALALVNSQASVADTIFWEDVATLGAELFVAQGAQLMIFHSDVRGGLPGVQGGGSVTWGDGMLDVDPTFVATSTPRDDHLAPTSLLIDAGWPARETGGTDGDVEPRILDGDGDGVQRVDIGWDEHGPTLLNFTGAPVLGGSVTFDTLAPAGHGYGLAFSQGTFDVCIPPYGSLLLDPASLQVLSVGLAPGTDVVQIPAQPILLGMSISFQALARDAALVPGSFSRRIDLRIQ